MEKIIKAAVKRGASDLHIKAGDVFRARIGGELVPLTKQRLTPEQTKAIALRLLPDAVDRRRIDEIRDYDCSWGMPGVGRFRVNLLRQRSSFMIVMRVIPFDVPSFDLLELPPILNQIADVEHGLILITGGRGSGRSSTMAAIINHINQTKQKHIVTLEDPIEFLHRDLKSSVTQREVGVDTASFREGLQAALRQDPDVILIDALRDAETVDTAIRAAETGHLVISALYTPDVISTVRRLVAVYASEGQPIAQARLANALRAVVSQRLIPRADGKGRVAAVEAMLATETIRGALRDRDRIMTVRELMAAARGASGMQTFEQHLADLVREKVILRDVASAAASDSAEFDAELTMPAASGGGEGEKASRQRVVKRGRKAAG